MEFGTLPFLQTVDVFELLIVVALCFAIPYDIYNTRQAWLEKERFLDDEDPALRRLGESRWENTRLRLAALFLIALVTLSAVLVPSPLQLAAPSSVDFQDVLNGFLQRIGLLLVVMALGYKAFNDATWRRYADEQWKTRVARARKIAADAAVPVVESPVVVVPPAPLEGKD